MDAFWIIVTGFLVASSTGRIGYEAEVPREEQDGKNEVHL